MDSDAKVYFTNKFATNKESELSAKYLRDFYGHEQREFCSRQQKIDNVLHTSNNIPKNNAIPRDSVIG